MGVATTYLELSVVQMVLVIRFGVRLAELANCKWALQAAAIFKIVSASDLNKAKLIMCQRGRVRLTCGNILENSVFDWEF